MKDIAYRRVKRRRWLEPGCRRLERVIDAKEKRGVVIAKSLFIYVVCHCCVLGARAHGVQEQRPLARHMSLSLQRI